MRAILSITVLLLFLVSCQDIKRVEKPDDLIPQEKMTDILLELALFQGAKSVNKAELEETGIHPHTYIWEQFGVDSLQFVRSNHYYAANYDAYGKIYSQVNERLELLQVKYDTLREIQQRREDSLRRTPKDSILLEREQLYRDSILEKSQLLKRIRRTDSISPNLR